MRDPGYVRWRALIGGAVVAALGLVGGIVAGCAGGDAEAQKPTALLSGSPVVEGELRCLISGCLGDGGAPITGWAHGSRAQRRALEPALATFRHQHPNDDLSRLAGVLLAWLAVDRACDDEGGRKGCDAQALGAAQDLAHRLAAECGPGTTGDIARAVEGASLRRQGQPGKALDLLDPLVSKLIDPWARALVDQEAVAAAIDDKRWARALQLIRVWLHEATSEEGASVRAAIGESLERVPSSQLQALLDAGPTAVVAADEDAEMVRLVTARLAEDAIKRGDARLAQALLTAAGGVLGDRGDRIAQLAAGAGRARVAAQTVGLALSLRDDRTRRRGADIAAGVAFGLGLPGSSARLVTRDDHGSLDRFEEALAALSTDGASILIAGSDEKEAALAAAFAEAHHIPVILLQPPASDPHAHFSFVVGAGAGEVEDALIAGLTSRGASPVVVLADDALRPRAPRPQVAGVRGCGEAGAPWKGLGVALAGVVLSASPACAREGLAAPTAQKIRFAAGLDADVLPLPPGSLVLTAGDFPAVSSESWSKSHEAPPNWWAALGHDAAVLAWAGVQVLPPQGTEDPAEVEFRRAQAATAMATAKIALWTTEARGFGGTRALPRTLGVREVGAPPRRP